jgi:hypothetical protein
VLLSGELTLTVIFPAASDSSFPGSESGDDWIQAIEPMLQIGPARYVWMEGGIDRPNPLTGTATMPKVQT